MYPLLETHSRHDIHVKQSRGMSGVVSFYLKGNPDDIKKFLKELKVKNEPVFRPISSNLDLLSCRNSWWNRKPCHESILYGSL